MRFVPCYDEYIGSAQRETWLLKVQESGLVRSGDNELIAGGKAQTTGA